MVLLIRVAIEVVNVDFQSAQNCWAKLDTLNAGFGIWIATLVACGTPGSPRPSDRTKDSPVVEAGSAAAGSAAPADATTRPRRDAEIDALVRKHVAALVDATAFPAIEVGVYVGGESYFVGQGEARPGEPPNDQTLFHIASLTKQHTALLTALMHVAGEIDIDAPIAACKDAAVKALCGKPATTLRHLLTHSSGLPMVPSDAAGDKTYSAAKLRAYLKRTALGQAPGKAFQYSTGGYGVIGMTLAERARKPYETLLRERVLDPLGSRAVFELDATARARLVQGHHADGKKSDASPTSPAFVPSGGLICSAADLLRLASVHADPDLMPDWRKAIELTREVHPDLRGFRGSAVSPGWHFDARGAYWHLGVASVSRSTLAFAPVHRTAIVILGSRNASLSDTRLEDAAFNILLALAANP